MIHFITLNYSYYLPRSHRSDKSKVLAFPEEFKMLAGDPFRRNYNKNNEMDQAIGWNCLGSKGPTRNPWLPRVNCPDGLRGGTLPSQVCDH